MDEGDMLEGAGQRSLETPELYLRLLSKFIDLLIAGAFFAFPTIVGPLAGLTYALIADGLKGGQSLGKRITGLEVLSTYRGLRPCDFRESMIRNIPIALVIAIYIIIGWIPFVGKPLSFLAAAVVFGYEIYLMSNDIYGLRLGDRLAQTRVVMMD